MCNARAEVHCKRLAGLLESLNNIIIEMLHTELTTVHYTIIVIIIFMMSTQGKIHNIYPHTLMLTT